MASLSASSPPHVSDDEDEFSMETFRNVGITMMVPPMINDVHRLMCETDTNLADFLCGIGGVLPVDPVRGCGPDGETYIYDRGALIEWSKRPENQIAETKEEKEEEGGVLDDEGKKLKEQKRKFIGPRGVPICLDDFKHDPEIKAGIEKIIDDYVSKMNNKNVDEATEVCRETSWQPYGKQLPGSKRQSFLKMSQKEQIDSIGTTDLSIALSKAYRELDEYREIMSEVLEDWKCPCMVVIGEEGHGKSSLMEQVWIRTLTRCTLMCIILSVYPYIIQSRFVVVLSYSYLCFQFLHEEVMMMRKVPVALQWPFTVASGVPLESLASLLAFETSTTQKFTWRATLV